MDFFIKKIFDGKNDELVHLQFQKFSKGIFKDRAIVIAKKSSGNSYSFKINTSYEYANEFVRFLAEKLNERKTYVTGIIVSTRDLNGINFVNKKQFMGVKQYIIDKEMSGNEILELCNKFPSSFIGLSFSVNGSELKIKPKAPKSAKPSSKGNNNNNVDFCKLRTSDISLINSLIFDDEIAGLNFREIEIKHDFIVNEIIISDELKKETGNDYGKIRGIALRKGKVVRRIKVDDREIIKEREFEV